MLVEYIQAIALILVIVTLMVIGELTGTSPKDKKVYTCHCTQPASGELKCTPFTKP